MDILIKRLIGSANISLDISSNIAIHIVLIKLQSRSNFLYKAVKTQNSTNSLRTTYSLSDQAPIIIVLPCQRLSHEYFNHVFCYDLANVTLVAGTITGNTFYDYVGFDTYVYVAVHVDVEVDINVEAAVDVAFGVFNVGVHCI